MKKTFRILGMMLMVVIISMGMTACSESDDDVVKAEIYGKWYTERMEIHQSLTRFGRKRRIHYRMDGLQGKRNNLFL